MENIDARPYKIVVHGTGIEYNRYKNRLDDLTARKVIEIIGVSSEDEYYKLLDGYTFIAENDLASVDFDYILITNFARYNRNVRYDFVDKIIPATILDIPDFDFMRWIKLKNEHISIISNNCWGGLTYHYMGLPFDSPFINMWCSTDDYLLLLENFEEYIKGDIFQVGKGYDVNIKHEYPVMSLNNKITLHFNHYNSEQEAVIAWKRRLKRLNIKNLLVQMTIKDKDVSSRFLKLNVGKKIGFVPYETDCDELITVKPYLTRWDKNAELWKFVTLMAKGRFCLYDVWELLENKKIKLRIR